MTKKKNKIPESPKQLVIVGDSECGKRALLLAFSTNKFVTDYVSNFFGIPTIPVHVDERLVHLTLVDTSGTEDFTRLRSLLYRDTKIVLICFSVDNPMSLRNAVEKWAPEIRIHCNQSRVILVACKTDLRTDPETISTFRAQEETLVTTQMGTQAALRMNADAYMECSAKTFEGVKELLNEAARLSSSKPSRRTVKCKCVLQ